MWFNTSTRTVHRAWNIEKITWGIEHGRGIGIELKHGTWNIEYVAWTRNMEHGWSEDGVSALCIAQ